MQGGWVGKEREEQVVRFDRLVVHRRGINLVLGPMICYKERREVQSNVLLVYWLRYPLDSQIRPFISYFGTTVGKLSEFDNLPPGKFLSEA